MVCIRVCEACKNGDHQNCENIKDNSDCNLDGSFMLGGFMCACNCNGRTKEQIWSDTIEWTRKILRADIESNTKDLDKEFSKTVDNNFWGMI